MVTTNDAQTVVVLDFETTGLSPAQGDRAIEIGAVKIIDGEVVDSYQQLMNPGRRISSFIENYTGITNRMLRSAPPAEEVMLDFYDFVDSFNLVAHNASFDRKFLDAEFENVRRRRKGDFACSMLVARRLFPDAPNHKLGTLVDFRRLPTDGTYHRALADSQMATHLWLDMIQTIRHEHAFAYVPFDVMQELSTVSKYAAAGYLARVASRYRSN